ncbi:hypothetical protein SS05631_c16550 [Sinorhizobium sp. CCBAU 05631]|nr:hypothetical protein SS05631_c16550 [Sinorhizobium sp. CCBAU 05631]
MTTSMANGCDRRYTLVLQKHAAWWTSTVSFWNFTDTKAT